MCLTVGGSFPTARLVSQQAGRDPFLRGWTRVQPPSVPLCTQVPDFDVTPVLGFLFQINLISSTRDVVPTLIQGRTSPTP